MIARDADQSLRRGACRALAGAAMTAGAFCLVTVGILVWNYQQVGGADALADSDALAPLKKSLLDGSADDATREKFRLVDHQLRVEYFRRRAFSRRGAWLLLCGLAVFVGGVAVLAELKKPLPARPAPRVINDELQRSASLGRRSMGVVCATVFGGVIAWAAMAGWSPDLAGLQRTGDGVASSGAGLLPVEASRTWARFRGPGGNGVVTCANTPDRWDGPTGKGILWKSQLSLPGKNSPIVWGNRVFLTGATSGRRMMYCFDADTGDLLWSKSPIVVGSRSGEETEPEFSGYAASTAVTDGKSICAIFANGDLVCFDFKGKQLWAKALGYFDNSYGHSSSLTMWKGLLIVQLDQGGAEDEISELRAIEAATGKERWSVSRKIGASWPSPIVITAAGRDQIITGGDPHVISYSAENGDELWRVRCLENDVGPSPVYAGGKVFVVNEAPALTAIRPDGSGDVTETHVAWRGEDGLPDTVSPISNGKLVWLVSSAGLTCYNVADGKMLYMQDMDDTFTASPSLVADKLYLLSDNGVMHIVSAGDKFKPIAKNPLGEKTVASPAFVDGRIYIRGEKNLYCIGEK